jgi:arrestin-related trafficking adapter 3/6
MKRIARSDPPVRIELLNIKSEHGPILPLESDDPEAFRQSPLFSLFSADKDPSESASSLFGPGPWGFHRDLQLPMSCSILHVTNKNKKSNITISHQLKCVIRVEGANDTNLDPKTGKRKQYDIVIQTPVQILSVSLTLCNDLGSFADLLLVSLQPIVVFSAALL